MRLEGKTAIVVGGGQSEGSSEAIGNGRATAILFAREGARVLVVDRDLASAQKTVDLIASEGNEAKACAADVTREDEVAAAMAGCVTDWGSIDVLHNNVGVSVAGNDAPIDKIESDNFDRIVAINLRSMVYTCKHTIPVMQKQGAGAIVNISSVAAISVYPWVSYKTTKSAVVAMTKQIAINYAGDGIRANVILPGLMDTPMAVDTRARTWGLTREEVAAERDAKVPLRGKMGTGWDVAYAALFLASDEAGFVSGTVLTVDGAASCRVG